MCIRDSYDSAAVHGCSLHILYCLGDLRAIWSILIESPLYLGPLRVHGSSCPPFLREREAEKPYSLVFFHPFLPLGDGGATHRKEAWQDVIHFTH
jgi:hypothetical protein